MSLEKIGALAGLVALAVSVGIWVNAQETTGESAKESLEDLLDRVNLLEEKTDGLSLNHRNLDAKVESNYKQWALEKVSFGAIQNITYVSGQWRTAKSDGLLIVFSGGNSLIRSADIVVREKGEPHPETLARLGQSMTSTIAPISKGAQWRIENVSEGLPQLRWVPVSRN